MHTLQDFPKKLMEVGRPKKNWMMFLKNKNELWTLVNINEISTFKTKSKPWFHALVNSSKVAIWLLIIAAATTTLEAFSILAILDKEWIENPPLESASSPPPGIGTIGIGVFGPESKDLKKYF